jgi:hypothetical protein
MDPATLDEYNIKSNANHRMTGYGVETAQVLPCPFCGAADFLTARILQFNTDMAKGAVCTACGRGARMITTRDASGVYMEMVQTQGDNPPPYLPPMRRERYNL